MGARGPLKLVATANPARGDTSKGKRSAADKRGTAKAPPGAPDPPAVIKGEALREWKRVVPVLDGMGVLSSLDRGLLVTYCQTWARWCELDKQLTNDGMTHTDEKGTVRKHPAWTMARECTNTLATLATQLALTPAARLRLPAPSSGGDGGDQDDILD